MAYYLLSKEILFPHPSLAGSDGLLAIGGDLSIERLLLAYQCGIFPWFNNDNMIMWWSPDPRMVLYPDELKISKSMRPYFNQSKLQITIDYAFSEVINACKEEERKDQEGTWITKGMIDAYCQLHELGYAHSVEVWKNSELVGGLYGLSLGKIFFGESMFSRANNASKFGFISLIKWLKEKKFKLIDCQQETTHLKSMGAKSISRESFLHELRQNQLELSNPGKWSDWILPD